MGVLRGILAVCVTIVIGLFAAFNRQSVDLYWNPLNLDDVLSVPVYAVGLVGILFGFFVGAIMVWLNMSSLRRQKRKQKKEIKTLEKEVSRLKDDKFSAQPPAADIFPALPSQ